MEYVKLKDICFFLPKSKIKAGEGMDNGKYIFFTSSDTKVSKINEYLYDDEAVIIGTGGKPSCNYCKGKFSVSTDNFVLKSNTINIKYLYYFLRNNNLSILEKGFHGAGLKHISKDYVSDINVPLLDYSKQCKIVSTLDSIYININFYKDQLKNFDNIVKSQFVELFGDPIDNPLNWKVADFKEVVYFQEGPGVRNWQFRDSGIKLINIRNLVDDSLVLENTNNYLSEQEVEEKYKHFLLDVGDYVMASSGVTWGKIAEIYEEHLPLCLNTSIIRLRPYDETVISKKYLFHYIKGDAFRMQIRKLITGSAQPNFGPTHLKKISIIVPPIELQNQFAAFVEQTDKSKYFGDGIH